LALPFVLSPDNRWKAHRRKLTSVCLELIAAAVNASKIRYFKLIVVPGLLRIRGYAAASHPPRRCIRSRRIGLPNRLAWGCPTVCGRSPPFDS
jgi:hypothetical protein